MEKMTLSEACAKMRELVGTQLDTRTQMELIDLFAATNMAGWYEGRLRALELYAPEVLEIMNRKH
jgi:hypothetical protein